MDEYFKLSDLMHAEIYRGYMLQDIWIYVDDDCPSANLTGYYNIRSLLNKLYDIFGDIIMHNNLIDGCIDRPIGDMFHVFGFRTIAVRVIRRG